MVDDPLLTTLLDLAAALDAQQKLIIGGGYGLYLKQLHLQAHPELQTLFSLPDLPAARTTSDIDLILRAEIVTNSASMKVIRTVLDCLGFTVVPTAKFTQFERPVGAGEHNLKVKIDLLAAPLEQYANRVPKDSRRVKPRPSVELHASKLEEALAVDRGSVVIPIHGQLSSGLHHATEVFIPQAFSYLLMKLFAFRDRLADKNKQLGQHHALDIYRIVGLLTKDEDILVRQLATEFANHPKLAEAKSIASRKFVSPTGIGRLRIREHPLFHSEPNLDRFGQELELMLSGNV